MGFPDSGKPDIGKRAREASNLERERERERDTHSRDPVRASRIFFVLSILDKLNTHVSQS